MLTHKLDLRMFPVFHWHVEEDVVAEFLTGLKGNISLGLKIGEWVLLQPEAVRFTRLEKEVWEIRGYSPEVVSMGAARVQEDVFNVVQRIIDFADKIKSGN